MKMKKEKEKSYSGIGGQAVLEGVMMRCNDQYAVAVRKLDGEIEVEKRIIKGAEKLPFWKKTPFVRGMFQFVDSLKVGTQALNYSASLFEEDDKEVVSEKKKKMKEKLEPVMMFFTMVLSFALAIGIFMILPYFITEIFSDYIQNQFIIAVIEGAIRIIIFVGYVFSISFMKDIKRLYGYHGAEHKCINCIEKGLPLTVDNVMKSSKLHKRCGTSFMLFVMLVSIVVFFFINVDNIFLRVVLRIALLPVIAGISYELIRIAGKSENIIVKILSAPGFWLQGLTTREPDRSMAEVAIASVEAVFDWKKFLNEEFGYVEEVAEEEVVSEEEYIDIEEIEDDEV